MKQHQNNATRNVLVRGSRLTLEKLMSPRGSKEQGKESDLSLSDPELHESDAYDMNHIFDAPRKKAVLPKIALSEERTWRLCGRVCGTGRLCRKKAVKERIVERLLLAHGVDPHAAGLLERKRSRLAALRGLVLGRSASRKKSTDHQVAVQASRERWQPRRADARKPAGCSSLFEKSV